MAAGAPASRVIVTRPVRDAQQWVQHLQQAGWSAEALPLIEIAPALAAPDVQALQQAWQSLDRYAACMFVSGNAVDYFFKQKMAAAPDIRAQAAINNVANSTYPEIPPGLRFLAPGPGTAAALRLAGVPAGQIDEPPADAPQFDSPALWQTVGQRDWQGRRVLVVRGQSADALASAGRDWLTRQWQDAGASVDQLSVYERRAPVFSAAQVQRMAQASADGSVWLFSSSEALAHLLDLPALAGIGWQQARALATHPRIAASVRSAGWGVVVESRPALKDILNTLRSIESKTS